MRSKSTKGMVVFLKLIKLSADDLPIFLNKENDLSRINSSNTECRLITTHKRINEHVKTEITMLVQEINKLIVSLFKFNDENKTTKIFVETKYKYLFYFINDNCCFSFQLNEYLHFLNNLYFANYSRGPPNRDYD